MLQFIELGAATDMCIINKDLRHGISAVCPGRHFLLPLAAHGDVDLLDLNTFGRKKRFGAGAISAEHFCIDRNFGHDVYRASDFQIGTRDYYFNIVFCEPLAIGQTVTPDSFWFII